MLSLRTISVPGLVVLWVAAGCGGTEQRVDLCGRSDPGELGAALDGGRLELTFLGGDGRVLGTREAAGDEATRLAATIPEGAARVEVSGYGPGGELVARGEGSVTGDGACACVALDGQHRALCAGVGCRVEDGACQFFDAETGAEIGPHTVQFGEADDAEVTGVTADTYLSSVADERDLNHGEEPRLVVTGDPARTALVRFDLSALPGAVVIEHAELVLSPCQEDGCVAGGSLAAFEVLEAWSEGEGGAGCASWNCRVEGVAWSVPGCGYLSEEDRARVGEAAAQASLEGGVPAALDVTEVVARWVADPAANRGLALAIDEQSSAMLASSEAPDAHLRPRLSVTYRLVAGGGGPADAGAPDAADPGGDGGPGGEMIAIPAGGFLMGCDTTRVDSCEANAVPLHAVSLSAYEIDRTEVTQEAFAACVDAGACPVPACEWDPVVRAQHPVVCVTWTDARDYCAWAGKRLPTEAEWEKAARGTDGRLHPWGDEPATCARANYFGCAGATQPVGIHPSGRSPYGVEDMAGNVSEYVRDRYAADYYATSPDTDPAGPTTGARRVRRGGGWGGTADLLTTFVRRSVAVDVTRNAWGFRCARPLP